MVPFADTPERILKALRTAASSAVVAEAEALRRRADFRLVVEEAGPEGPRLRGLVDTGFSQRFEGVLGFRAGRVEGSCECGEHPGPCAHLLALAEAWAAGGLGTRPLSALEGSWQSLFQALAPVRGRPVTPHRREVFGHWLDVVRTGSGLWGLRVCWRTHRAGSGGIGRGRLVPPDRVREEAARLGGEDDLRAVERVLAAGWPKSPGSGVSIPVEVARARVEPVLRALAEVDWVGWEGTREPLQLDVRPLVPLVRGEDRGGELALSVGWQGVSEGFWPAGSVRVVGSDPPWVEWEGVLRPVQGVVDGGALAALLRKAATVPEAELPSFLGTTVPALEDRGIGVELTGVEARNLVVSEKPTPCLYLTEGRNVLEAELRFRYGDYEVTCDNPSALLTFGGRDQRVFVRRDLEGEFQSSTRLRDLGFRPTDVGFFDMRGDAALRFVFDELPKLSDEWEVFGRDRLRGRVVGSHSLGFRVRLTAEIDWLDLEVTATADGEVIPLDEILRAFREGSRYVRLGDGAHALLPDEWLRRVGSVLDDLGLEKGKARLAPHLASRVHEVVEAATESEVDGREHWERLVHGLLDPDALAAYPLPDGLQGVLRPYQEKGYRWLRFLEEQGLGGILADDMGLGKTVQTLALLLSEAAAGRAFPSLVVAPTSVVPNWEAEARRFAPGLRVVRYEGLDRKELLEEFSGAHLVLTSYSILRRDARELGALRWNYAILDEAQAIKNAATQTARSARKLKARRRLVLTGTPLENHLGELWSQFQFLLPGLLGSERRFGEKYARPAAQGDVFAREELRRRVRPFLLRRLKGEVASELPEKVESVLFCEMGDEQARLYRSLLEASRERVFREVAAKGLSKARICVLDALLRLRQACCHPAVLPGALGHGVPSAKFDTFCDFVSEIVEEGHRVLVFSQFVSVLELLRRWFEEAGISHLYLDGRTRDRGERVRRFQEDESVSAFLVSLKAGGTGLNLTGADYVVLFDPWWNPAVEQQAIDRAHRIGQTRRVFSYKMITRNTVEEKIVKLQERKKELTDDLIRSESSWGGALTLDDLHELFDD